MFYPRVLRPCTLALAVATALGAPARASSLPGPVSQEAAFMIERSNSRSYLAQIHADYAYALGISGKGVRIAVLDSGISAGHLEFQQALKLAQGFDTATGSVNVGDRRGHGTHVAAIIGAVRDGRGIHGVAYDAQLLPIKVLQDNGTGSTEMLDRGLRHAIGKAPIANISIAAAGAYDPAAVREAVQAGMLVVVAAGNQGAPNPAWPARFAREPWANSQIIAVGAVDGENRIAPFSNRAGDTAAWFLVAPGVNIASAYADGGYVLMSGTSMAAPIVSGAAALLKQRWPALRAEQVAEILLLTATDLGAPGIDPIYGRGLLNVEQAMQPVGTVVTSSFNGNMIKVLESALQPSAATGKLWALAALGNLRVVGLDAFRRDFQVDLGAIVARPPSLTLEQAFGGIERRLDVGETVLTDGARLTAVYAKPRVAMDSLPASRTQARQLAAFSYVARYENGAEAAIGAGGMAAHYFGIGGLALANGLPLADPVLAHPYFSLVPNAAHAAIARQIGGPAGFKLKFGMLNAGLNRMFASQETPAREGPFLPGMWDGLRADATLIELSKSLGDAAFSLSFTQTSEADAYLGARSSGALALGQHATTGSVQLAGALLLTPGLALAAQAAYGLTPDMSSRNSLITGISGLRTNAFSLALIASDRLRKGDRFSLSLAQPMRAYAGQMTMDVQTGIDAAGAPLRQRLQFDMMPSGRELKAELGYQTPVGRDAAAALAVLLRRHPNHLAEAATERLLALRYTRRF